MTWFVACLCVLVRSVLGETPCEYMSGWDARPPFEYYSYASNGSRRTVEPQRDEISGLCIFPGASCAGPQECCVLADWADKEETRGHNFNLYLNLGAISLPLVLINCYYRRKAALERGEGEGGSFSWWAMAKGFLYMAAFAGEMVLMISLANLTQEKLPLPVRNSQMAADAYLSPLREVFQFLEDVMTVHINVAIGMQATEVVRSSLLLGVGSGLLLGSIAAAVTTGIAFWPVAINALLVPFSTSGAAGGACSLLESTEVIVETVRPYILLSSWQWPFQFANMALRGFCIGTQQWGLFLALTVLENGLQLVGLFCFFASNPQISTLGWMRFVGSAGAFVVMIGFLLGNQEVRQVYFPQGLFTRSEASTLASVERRDARLLVRQGLSAMASDLSVQLSMTAGIYVAGVRYGVGQMYQVSAILAAFPQYGIQWVFGVCIAFRIQGSQFLGAGNYAAFRRMFVICLLCVGMLAVTSVSTLWPFRDAISYKLARNACDFASESACVPVFEGVFGGPKQAGLQESPWLVFLVAMVAQCFYRVFKAGMYACHDWDFMLKASVGVVLVGSIPAFVIAVLVIDTSTALLVAMFVPFAGLGGAYALRISHNIKTLGETKSGTSSAHESLLDH